MLVAMAVTAAEPARQAVIPHEHQSSLERGAKAEQLAESGQITLSSAKRTSDDVSGTLTSPSGVMSFQTASSTSGISTAKGATPTRVEVILEVNGAVLHHVVDDANGTVTISTAETVTLGKRDVNILKTFQQEFARAALTAETFYSMPRATEMLWRLSEMYSEAPVGITLARVNVINLKPDPEQQADFDGAVPSQAKACGQSGGGFIDLHDQGNVCDKGHLWRSEAHDYCPQHGYITNSHQDFGCATSGCYGRCGSGCGPLNGQGAWQKDCLDHDVCNRTHGEQFGGCGDEWNEAADDYLNGTIHCIFDHC
ncbi:MAG: hypothetical protein ABIP49_00100 [Lysobacterales bacterium]